MAQPWRLHELTPAEARDRLSRTRCIILPAGTLEDRGPHLPLGADTIIVERLADDLSAQTGIVRSPAIPFGARSGSRTWSAGTAALGRKALHRAINELIASWEEDAGVEEVILLTAHADEVHREALAAVRTTGLVRVVDIFGFDFRGRLDDPVAPVHGGELDTSILLFLRPDLVTDTALADRLRATTEKGRRLYAYLLERVTALAFPNATGSHPKAT